MGYQNQIFKHSERLINDQNEPFWFYSQFRSALQIFLGKMSNRCKNICLHLQRVLVLVATDVDALCACKILQVRSYIHVTYLLYTGNLYCVFFPLSLLLV